jgi:hypothetical protein
MGKRSDFLRVERDFYRTPEAAVLPLLAHLVPGTRFIEPCAGDGRLIHHLEKRGLLCVWAGDIEPQAGGIHKHDATAATGYASWQGENSADMVITNPPWDRKILHPIIDIYRRWRPTWLLADADWAHTRQAAPFLPYCRKIVSIGRVKWIEDSKMTGKDNCAWYLFDATAGTTVFHGRTA